VDIIISLRADKDGVGRRFLSVDHCHREEREERHPRDLDLGATNLHTFLGVRGRMPTIADFILSRVRPLENVIIGTPVKNPAS
jgi:MinD-like ATPase involved in chromosome partitioning or flagellar assembly